MLGMTSVRGGRPDGQRCAAAQVVCVEARDRFGNLATVPQSCLRAQAMGPQGAVSFSPLEVLPGDASAGAHPQQQRRLGATFTVAGSYSLTVCVLDAETQVLDSRSTLLKFPETMHVRIVSPPTLPFVIAGTLDLLAVTL